MFMKSTRWRGFYLNISIKCLQVKRKYPNIGESSSRGEQPQHRVPLTDQLRTGGRTDRDRKQTNNIRNKQRATTESVCVEGQLRRARRRKQKQKKQQQWLTQISSGQEGLTLKDQIQIENKTIAIYS